jgi:glycerol-3-phosphate acyltransferase PlsY
LLVAGLIPVGYVIGMLPSAMLVARAQGIDITSAGSGNPGASNVIRVLGWKAGALVMLSDFAKGALASGIGMFAGGRVGAYALGIAAVIGHTYPLRRKGGKGVAAAGGMLVVLYPVIVAVIAPTWFVLSKVFRKASIASLCVIAALPVAVAVSGYRAWETAVIGAVAALLLLRHAANIKRLVRREEHDLAAPTR